MDITPADREELVRRVLKRAPGGRARTGLVRGVVDQLVGAMPAVAAVPEAMHVLIVHRASTPDLASRWRRATAAGADLGEVGVATEGRHTVVVARIRAEQSHQAREAALALDAQCLVREET
jgi:hypothetical protein